MKQEKCKQKCSKTSSTVPITILMLKSISGHGKGKGGKGNQKSVDVNESVMDLRGIGWINYKIISFLVKHDY